MTKHFYRLDLNEKEFNLIKDKLNEELLNKVKKIKISEKKVDSMRRAISHKQEIARARFFDALHYLNENDIETTQYNMKKYKQIPYPTSKKYFDLFKLARESEDIEMDFEENKSYSEALAEHEEMMQREIGLLAEFEMKRKKR